MFPVLALVISGLAVATLPARSDADDSNRTLQADQLRLQAKQRAERKLGYPDAYDLTVGPADRRKDFIALSAQISRLADVVRALGEMVDRPAEPGVLNLGLPGGALADPVAAYGPEGPTARSVRLILEYRLLVAGNSRLDVGKVTETGSAVMAEVMTKDGSLVETYAVDKKTGAWKPVR